MSRDLDLDRPIEDNQQDRTTQSHGRGGGSSNSPRDPEPRPVANSKSRHREPIGRYRVSPAELRTMDEIGRFRTVEVADLTQFHYGGKEGEAKQDVGSLLRQGLIEKRIVPVGRGKHFITVVALSRAGKRLVEANTPRGRQKRHARIVKPREIGHDAAIYRMYQAEAERIEAEGGHVERVVLDYELKQDIYSPLAKAHDLPATEYTDLQAQVAEENGLTVVDGKIPLPDLRIEYETAEGDHRQIDLELATEHYTRGQMSAKSRAGFKTYGVISTSRGSRPEWEGREITAGIL
jgi:hypothetical protein